MACTTSILRFLAFILNFINFIFSVLVACSCLYSIAVFNRSGIITVPCIIGLLLSIILAFNAALGYFIVYQNSTRLIWTYLSLMTLLMVAQIVAIFFASIEFKNLADEIVSNAWHAQIVDSSIITSYEIEVISLSSLYQGWRWRDIRTKFECCGKFGPTDYSDYGQEIPISCYANGNSTGTSDYFTNGCLEKITDLYDIGESLETISNWILIGLEGTSALVHDIFAITQANQKRRKNFY